MKEKYSKNKRAKKIVGTRKYSKCTIFIDSPAELGYTCPVCKNKNLYAFNYDDRLEWSEYNTFLWCRVCDKDYPSCLCMADIDKAIDIYLDCIESIKNSK